MTRTIPAFEPKCGNCLFSKNLQNTAGKYSGVSLRAAIVLKIEVDKSLQ